MSDFHERKRTSVLKVRWSYAVKWRMNIKWDILDTMFPPTVMIIWNLKWAAKACLNLEPSLTLHPTFSCCIPLIFPLVSFHLQLSWSWRRTLASVLSTPRRFFLHVCLNMGWCCPTGLSVRSQAMEKTQNVSKHPPPYLHGHYCVSWWHSLDWPAEDSVSFSINPFNCIVRLI